MSVMQRVNWNNFFLNAAKIWAQNEKDVKRQICEVIYERNFENNFIVFFNDLLYFFYIINFYNFQNPFFKYGNPLYSHNFIFLNSNFNSIYLYNMLRKVKKCPLFQKLVKIQENFEIWPFLAIPSLIINQNTSFRGH